MNIQSAKKKSHQKETESEGEKMRINELERVAGGNPHRGILSRQAADHLQIDVTVKLILKCTKLLSHVFPSFYVMRLGELYRERDGTFY